MGRTESFMNKLLSSLPAQSPGATMPREGTVGGVFALQTLGLRGFHIAECD